MADYHVHIPYDQIENYHSFLTQQRLNLEIYFTSGSLDKIRKKDILSLKETLSYKPLLTIHSPFMDLSPGAVDSKVRDVTMERFHQVLEIASVLHAKAVVFHSGYEKWEFGLDVNLWLEESLKTWKPLLKKAESIGVKIAIENIFEDEPSNLQLLMQKMSSDSFGICFDTGHLNLFSKVSLEEWMGALNPFIIELHLHDNNKTADQHLPIGDGTFDFEKFFSLLQNREYIYTLEAHSKEHAIKSIERLKQYVKL